MGQPDSLVYGWRILNVATGEDSCDHACGFFSSYWWRLGRHVLFLVSKAYQHAQP